MASGSSTPTSAGSYTEADIIAKLSTAADASDYFSEKEINALLRTKGVAARGKKAQKCKQLALACTAKEVRTSARRRRRKHWPRRRNATRRNATPGS